MSGIIKGIGKVFKKIVKVVKKVALPALAIGAAIVTGGAALGIMPGLASLGGSIGLSAGLTSVLSTAGTGALLGGGMSLLTGGNPIKGMTAGFIGGAAVGGLGQVLQPAAQGATQAATSAGNIATGFDTPITASNWQSAIGGGAAQGGGGAASQGVQGLGTSLGTTAANTASSVAAGSMAPITPVSGVGAVGATAAPAVTQTVTQGGGGLLGAFNRMNPYVQASLIQGLGSGLSSAAASKDMRRAERERYERLAANYEGYEPAALDPFGPIRREPSPVWKIDPATGDLYRDYEG